MDAPRLLRRYIWLSLIALFLPALSSSAFASNASGHFEVCCNGVGIFLAKIDGAPGKLVLVSYLPSVAGTMGGNDLGQGRWSDVSVFPNGCFPKCKSIAHGKVWVDAWATPKPGLGPPKGISGKYEIDFNGKRLEGRFIARRHRIKRLLCVCE
jgi:predicted Rdx family selenoprotein